MLGMYQQTVCRAHSGQHPSPTLAPVTAHTSLPPSFSETLGKLWT